MEGCVQCVNEWVTEGVSATLACSSSASVLFGCAWIDSALLTDNTLKRNGSFPLNLSAIGSVRAHRFWCTQSESGTVLPDRSWVGAVGGGVAAAVGYGCALRARCVVTVCARGACGVCPWCAPTWRQRWWWRLQLVVVAVAVVVAESATHAKSNQVKGSE